MDDIVSPWMKICEEFENNFALGQEASYMF